MIRWQKNQVILLNIFFSLKFFYLKADNSLSFYLDSQIHS